MPSIGNLECVDLIHSHSIISTDMSPPSPCSRLDPDHDASRRARQSEMAGQQHGFKRPSAASMILTSMRNGM
jgi:hypothetical protein